MSALVQAGNSYVIFETLSAANSVVTDETDIFTSGTRIIFSITYIA
jgi:hypothetical protein